MGEKIFLEEYDEFDSHLTPDGIKLFQSLEDLRSRVYQAIESERQKGAIRNAFRC